MKKERERTIAAMFKGYAKNKKELEQDYNIPMPMGISYDKIAIQKNISVNGTEYRLIDYIAKREDLFKKVYIVDEVLRWFELEGHGRDCFIRNFLMRSDVSWVKAEMKCNVSVATLCRWRRDVFEKAETVAEWVNFF